MIPSHSVFAAKLCHLYSDKYSSTVLNAWIDRYTDALDRIGAVDYKALWTIFDEEYNKTTLPPVSWLIEAANRARKRVKATNFVNVTIYDPRYKCTRVDCFLSNTTKEEILKTYEKMFPNTKGWKVLEVSPWMS